MNIVKNLLLVIIGLLIPLFALEIFVRFSHYSWEQIHIQDPLTNLLILTPDKEFIYENKCLTSHLKTNPAGFNSPSYDKKKPDNTFRIAILGDSYIEALQVASDNNVSRLLENKLQNQTNQSINYQVLSFGISSHGTYSNLLYLKDYVLAYEPDLIINAFTPTNDVTDDFIKLNYHPNFSTDGQLIIETPAKLAHQDAGYIIFIKSLAKKSAAIRWLYDGYLNLKNNKKTSINNPGAIPPEYQVFLKNYPADWQVAWQEQEVYLNALRQMATDNQSNFLLISLTEGFRVHPQLAEQLKKIYDVGSWDFNKPEAQLEKISADNNIN